MRLEDVIAENIELDKIDIHIVVSGLQDAMKLAQTLDKLVGKDVMITADKIRQKRSLNANSYERVLESKIADVIGSSKDEVHNMMLSRYGQYERDKDGNIVFVLMPASVEIEKEPEIHLKPTGHTEKKNGATYYWYAKMKPSHQYNTKEMAILLDGVISECNELDIDTMTPDEIKRLESEVDG